MALRLKGEAPFRCRQCGTRFATKADESDAVTAPRHVSFADYLGLTGSARRVFTDDVLVGALSATIFLALIIAFFALAVGWIDPLFLHARAS